MYIRLSHALRAETTVLLFGGRRGIVPADFTERNRDMLVSILFEWMKIRLSVWFYF